MSGWRTIQLGDLASFRNGLNFSAKDRGRGLAIIGVSDFKDRSFVEFEDLEQLIPSALGSDESLIQCDDILFVRSNGNRELIGRSLFVSQSPPMPTSHSGFTIRLRFHDERANPRFFSYLLRSGLVRQHLSSQGGGTSINNLNQGVLSRLEVPLPPIYLQARIASILGAYDDLIEVNRRRIKLLEEMARGLFEEWFVRFRFPGHETVPLLDTPNGPLPEGWTWQPFSKLAEFINGYAFKPSDFEKDGLPIVKIPELKNGITTKTPRNSGVDVPDDLHIKPGNLLFSWSGTFAISEWTDGDALLNQHLFLVTPTGSYKQGFLKQALISALPRFDKQGVGATMKHIRRSALDNISVATPVEHDIAPKANSFFNANYAQIVNLRKQISALAASRDLLLPRLISGQLSVEAAEQQLAAE